MATHILYLKQLYPPLHYHTAVLQLLFAPLSAYGCPEVIVSDNAKVFKAHQYLASLAGLEINPKYIEKGKPWQNLIESQFKIQYEDYRY